MPAYEHTEDEQQLLPGRPRCLAGKQLAYSDLMKACLDAGQKENTFKKAFKALKEAGTISKVGKLWQITEGEPAASTEQDEQDNDS